MPETQPAVRSHKALAISSAEDRKSSVVDHLLDLVSAQPSASAAMMQTADTPH